MKTILKTVLAGLLAILLGLLLRQMAIWSAEIRFEENSPTAQIEAELVQARAMFLEKPDDIQLLTAAILDDVGLLLVRGDDGLVYRVAGDEVIPYEAPEAAAGALTQAFGSYHCGGEVQDLAVTEDAVLFYTGYTAGGCAGFLYEREANTTSYYETIELVENWQLFYEFPAS